jgi:hypothetical protein
MPCFALHLWALKAFAFILFLMTKYTFLLLSLVALAGCGEKDGASRPENLLAGNDFESLEGWTNDVKLVSLTKEKAHSGLYSVHVGPGMDYSNGFNGELGKLSPTKFDKVQIKGWVFVPDAKSTAALITQLIDPADTSGKPALWEATSLERATKAPNRWVEIDRT